MKNIAAALIKAQREIGHAAKDAKNPHFKNDYATLESVIDAVKGAANRNDIYVAQTGGKDGEGQFVETVLLHSSGESLTSKLYLSLDRAGMQQLGSAISYARRYALAAIFCIAQVDDDGQAASQPRPALTTIKPEQPGPEMGNPHLEGLEYIIPNGTYARRRFSEVDFKELRDYVERREDALAKDPSKKPLWWDEFAKRATAYIVSVENGEFRAFA